MDLNQALEHANSTFMPELLYMGGIGAMQEARIKNEEAIRTLREEWMGNPNPSFSFSLVRALADRNRELCDVIGADVLREERGSSNLARALSDEDTFAGIAAMQGRSMQDVRKAAANSRDGLASAYAGVTLLGAVSGIDIETTSRNPEQGYIVNVGWELIDLEKGSSPVGARSEYCSIPDEYEHKGVPLADIHHIAWSDIAGKKPFRENRSLQVELLTVMQSCPYLAHNAAFEDSWFMLHLNGYAEARKEGKITIVDTRDVCRYLDGEVATIPREQHPATLENWALRRGTLKAGEKERHLGLDDVDLMLRTAMAEFTLKGLIA